jgi:hypothetical protein
MPEAEFFGKQHTIWTNNLAQLVDLINIFGKTRFLWAFFLESA